MTRLHLAAAAALGLAAALPAAAHVTIEPGQAQPGSTIRAAFRIPHGCDGAAMTRLTVRLPEGATQVRPMPKPGWTLRLVPREDAAAPAAHGAVPELAEVVWEGGRLDDAHYDEFVLRLRLPDRPGELFYIPVVQDCEGGRSAAWVEIPEPGRRVSDYRTPAPAVRLMAR
ncbi:YcnI family protein [Falsiroseomonas sp. CW058]|uniref:YcnI family protein n=1 Tax=Falsiroseomonas sp. CW058 TaxID=3388664 RepID=UPI003D311E4E